MYNQLPPDEYYVYNDDPHKRLKKFRINIFYVIQKLYEKYNTPYFIPDFNNIPGSKLDTEDQTFLASLEKEPKRLEDLWNRIKLNIKKEKVAGQKYSQQLHIYKMKEYLIEHRKEYRDEISYIQRQWYYKIFGYWVWINGKPTWLPPWYYMYLTTWDMGDIGHAEYRNVDLRNFVFKMYLYLTTEAPQIDENGETIFDKDGFPVMKEYGFRTCFGDASPKSRRRGETHQDLNIVYEIISILKGASVLGGIIGFNGSNAQELYLTKLLPAFKKKPFWCKPIWTGSSSPQTGLNFNNPSYIEDNDELESSIDFATTSDRKYYDSKKAYVIDCEEEGKTVEQDIYHGWQDVLKPTLSQGAGGKIHGLSLHPTTVRDQESGGGANFKRLCDDSNFDKREKVSGQTKTGLIVNFFSAVDGMEGYIDKYGNSVIEKPTQSQAEFIKKDYGSRYYLESKRAELLKDKSPKGVQAYMSFLREFPIYYEECFIGQTGDIGFNTIKLQARKSELEVLPHPKRVNFYNVADKVEMRAETNGRWEIYEDPLLEYANKYVTDSFYDWVTNGMVLAKKPQNPKFVMCGDVYKFDNKNEQQIRKRQSESNYSSGGGAILRIRDKSIDNDEKPIAEWKTYTFWASYCHRMPSVEDYCKDMLNAAIYFGAMMYPEMDNPALAEYFVRMGYMGYLLYGIDELGRKPRSQPGYFARHNKQKIFTLINDYIESRIGCERSVSFIDECLTIQSIDDMRNYDRFTAHGGCLLAHESLHVKMFGETKTTTKYNANDYYQTYR